MSSRLIDRMCKECRFFKRYDRPPHTRHGLCHWDRQPIEKAADATACRFWQAKD